VTKLDWIALAFVALCALGGLRRGLIGTALALAGLVGGAILGDRIGPHLLSGGERSAYTPIAALAGAIIGAVLLRAVASMLASFMRGGLHLLPPLHLLDSIGGFVAGAASGLLIIWVIGAVALQLPGQQSFRRTVQRSLLLRHLNEIAPPTTILNLLDRIDDLPALVGPAPPSLPASPAVLAAPAVRAAAASVVRVTDLACGAGVEGSGWVAEPHLVVTAAHVVAGGNDIRVDGDPARVFAIDHTDDVAVLDVPGLEARPLRYGDAHSGAEVAILGYPEDGPFDARAGRMGETLALRINGQVREVTEFSGLVRHGNSGGPVIGTDGVVETTVFAKLVGGSQAGFGVPSADVSALLGRARAAVSPGSC
jgi:uncharacterized membrane protein required for colicin V production